MIARRLRDSTGDISHWSEFDYVIINDDLRQSVLELEAIISRSGNHEQNKASQPAMRERVKEILAA